MQTESRSPKGLAKALDKVQKMRSIARKETFAAAAEQSQERSLASVDFYEIELAAETAQLNVTHSRRHDMSE